MKVHLSIGLVFIISAKELVSLDAVAPKSTHGELQTHLALALAMDSWVEEL